MLSRTLVRRHCNRRDPLHAARPSRAAHHAVHLKTSLTREVSMRHHPPFEEFQRLAGQGNLVPVYRRLTGDTLTPVSAFCKIQEGDWAFLFESVVGGERLGRYSFLGSGPFQRFEAHGRRVRLVTRDGISEREHPDPLQLLQDLLTEYRTPPLVGLPRFLGGCVGYAGYDTVRYVERLPNAPPDDRGLPDLCFGFYDRMVVFDHLQKTIIVIAHADTTSDPRRSYPAGCDRVDRLVERLQQGVADLQLTDIDPFDSSGSSRSARSNFTHDGFLAAVERCKEYIRAGDIFQVVL